MTKQLLTKINTRYFRQDLYLVVILEVCNVKIQQLIYIYLLVQNLFIIYGVDSVGLCDYGFINNTLTITSEVEMELQFQY